MLVRPLTIIVYLKLYFKEACTCTFTLCFILLHANTLSAQITIPLHFESLSIDNGLSQGFVSSVVQDKKGLMWFATGDGLNKYDGYNFTVYHHDPSDNTSISSDDLTAVFEDSKGRLWVGTRSNGIDIFDRESNTFFHIRNGGKNSLRSNYILEIMEDKTGTMWIRTKEGVDRLEIVNGKSPPAGIESIGPFIGAVFQFTHIKMDSAFEANKAKYGAEKIFIDSWGIIFFITNNHIHELQYNAAQHSYRLLPRFQFAVTDSSFIPDLTEDTANHSYLFNNKEVIKFAGYDFTAPQKIYEYSPLELRWGIDKNKRLWISDKGHLIQLNLSSGNVQYIVPAATGQMKALSYATLFFTDRTGIMWVATGGYGIFKYDAEMERFNHLLPQANTYQLLQSNSGSIITNNFDAITVKKGQPASVSNFMDADLLKKKFPKLGIMSIAKDSADNLWIGIHGGIIRYSINTKEVRRINLPFTDFATAPFPIYADKANNLWMGYNKYLVRYSPASNTFTSFNYPIQFASYDYDFLQSIYEDGGLLWLGSINGLLSFDVQNGLMKEYYTNQPADTTSISNNFILSFCADVQQPGRYLWIGTKGGGLNRLDKATNTFIRYTTKNGLANNVVYGILPDDNGNLWLSTNKGLTQFNPAKKTFRNFDVSDGLQSNEFNRYAYTKTKDGLLFFGGLNGVNYFNPADIKPLGPPNVLLTGFKLFNKTVTTKTLNSPLKKDIAFTKSITLKYAQNVVAFQFAAMDYRKQGNIQYRYKLDGFDNDWVYSGTVREATYTNLDPGDYRFEVQASFENGLWGASTTGVDIIVVPPWWRTWWFITLSVASTMSILYAFYRFRLYQLTRMESLRNRIARDLHDEVGSSISTIAIYSKIVHEQVGSATFDNEPLLKKITDYATEIMESMNDIVWNINSNNDAFEHIISRMREHAYQLFEAKGYLLHFNFDDNLYRMKLQMEKRRDFYLIYKEALNNIAKYADGKNVWITLTVTGSHINLIIKDDGQGFDRASIRKGSNGLNNMQFRTNALQGKISISSSPGQGTEINVTF